MRISDWSSDVCSSDLVAVRVAVAPGLAQPHAVDDRGVVERVGDDGIVLAQQRLEQAAVGVEAGGVEDRVALAEEVGARLLQLLVQVLGRSEEGRVGKDVVMTCKILWAP